METNDDFGSQKELLLQIIEVEILPRLPAKSLGRCKCVCKQWKLIISAREFIRKNLSHMSKSLTNHKYLETYWTKDKLNARCYTFTTSDRVVLNNHSSVIRSLPFRAPRDTLYILGSMDGLICVCLRITRNIALWNPLTGDYKMLPNSNYPQYYNIYEDAFGFYYNSFDNDYKLLHVVSNGAEAYIYSHRSNSWRKIQCFEEKHPSISYYCWSSPTFSEGSLYFVFKDGMIVAFDVKSEKFREIHFPPVPSGLRFCGRIVVVKNCAHLCISYKNGMEEIPLEHAKADLWKMMDDDSWKKVATFCGKQLYSDWSFKWVYVTRNGNSHVIGRRVAREGNAFNKINIKDLVTHFSVNVHESQIHSYLKTVYVESLVSPNC